jgi:hypothetical protein
LINTISFLRFAMVEFISSVLRFIPTCELMPRANNVEDIVTHPEEILLNADRISQS